MSVLACRSCGCLTSADPARCPGQLGLGGTCRCHRVAAAAPPSGGPRLPPNEVAPQLLANVRERGDNWGDLANATGDELRDALLLAARQLNAFHEQLRARAQESGPYMIGLWADELHHVDPCDCDLDEENAGTNCMANSEWTYAVLADGGAFAAQPVVKLPRHPPYREDDEVPDLSHLEAEVGRMRWVMSHIGPDVITLLEDYDRLNPAWIDWMRTGQGGPAVPMYREQVLTRVDPEPNDG